MAQLLAWARKPCRRPAGPGARRALPTALPGTEGSHRGQLARPCLSRWGEWGLVSARPCAGSRHRGPARAHTEPRGGAPRSCWPRPRLRRLLRTRGGCQHRVDGHEGLDLCCVPAAHGAPRWCWARAPSPLCTCSLSWGVPAGHPAFPSRPPPPLPGSGLRTAAAWLLGVASAVTCGSQACSSRPGTGGMGSRPHSTLCPGLFAINSF